MRAKVPAADSVGHALELMLEPRVRRISKSCTRIPRIPGTPRFPRTPNTARIPDTPITPKAPDPSAAPFVSSAAKLEAALFGRME